MITGLPLEYGYARAAGRLSQRPDERLWLQLRSARSVPAVAEAVRASPAASMVSGVALSEGPDALELAFRQQFRTRVNEVASWAPDAWRAAVSFCRHLIDLPVLPHLLGPEQPAAWIALDPQLAGYALPSRRARRSALLSGPLHAIVLALEAAESVTPGAPRRRAASRPGVSVHPALSAWHGAWQSLWPSTEAGANAALGELVGLLQRHALHFGLLAVEDTAAARQQLTTRVLALLHRASGQPAALFACLALFALDLERLRTEFVVRDRLGARA